MSAFPRARLVSIGKAIAATVIIAAFMIVVPLAPVLLAPFLALPAAHVVTRHWWASGLVVAVVASALLYLAAGMGIAFLVFMVVASAGMTLGWAVRAEWRFPRSLAFTTSSLLVAL